MKRALSMVLWRMLLTAFTIIFCEVPADAKPEFPPATAFVTDAAHLLSGSERDSLNNELTQLEKDTGWEVAVVTIPSLEGDTVEDVAQKLFVTYGIGKKGTDNGVLFLVGRAERKLRIHTGYHAETVLPDIVASRIIRDVIAVKTKKENWSGGIIDGAHEIIRLVRDAKEHPGRAAAHTSENDFEFMGIGIIWWILIACGIIVLIAMWLGRHSSGYSSSSSWISSDGGGGGFFSGGGGGDTSSFGGGDSGGGGASGDG